MSDDDAVGAPGDAIEALVLYGRVSERLMAVMAQVGNLATALASVVDLDPELGPEIKVAVEKLIESGEALARASVFVEARYTAKKERAVDA